MTTSETSIYEFGGRSLFLSVFTSYHSACARASGSSAVEAAIIPSIYSKLKLGYIRKRKWSTGDFVTELKKARRGHASMLSEKMRE